MHTTSSSSSIYSEHVPFAGKKAAAFDCKHQNFLKIYTQDNNTLWSLRAEESNWKCRHRGCLREQKRLLYSICKKEAAAAAAARFRPPQDWKKGCTITTRRAPSFPSFVAIIWSLGLSWITAGTQTAALPSISSILIVREFTTVLSYPPNDQEEVDRHVDFITITGR